MPRQGFDQGGTRHPETTGYSGHRLTALYGRPGGGNRVLAQRRAATPDATPARGGSQPGFDTLLDQ